jgi:ubiquinone/menaquinone biosynthesis C-methylase UbiE
MANNKITQNKQAHDKIYGLYNLKHTEIYNKYEQERLKKLVDRLVRLSAPKKPKVLDVGAGTGNLSRKFLDYDCNVTASDVSAKSLNLLKEITSHSANLKTKLIVNENLPFKNDSFDIVTSYSVLHHIPNYLNTFKEMLRVAKKNGLIFIDHEANKNRYFPDKYLQKYNYFTRQTRMEHIKKLYKTGELFSFEFAKTAFIKLFIDRKYEREGDIHIWKDDHIEWEKIKRVANKRGSEIVEESDYLLYKPKGGMKNFNIYKKVTSDTKYVIIRNKN